MADINLSTIAGGGGGFITKFASGLIVVTSGATGTFATLTPPSGQKVRLTAIAGVALQTNLTTVTVGGVDIVTAVELEGENLQPNAANEFKINFGGSNQNFIDGDTDEVMELKTDVSLSSNTNYTYQFGV